MQRTTLKNNYFLGVFCMSETTSSTVDCTSTDQSAVETAAASAVTEQTAANENAFQAQENQTEKPKKAAKEVLKSYFTATRIAYMAIFTALSYVLGLFDFSLLPGTPVDFLKLDFSNIFVLIGGFSLGPVAGSIIAVLKELLHAITVGHTAFVGELANIIMVLPYMLIPSIIYKKHKGIKTVIWTVAVGCLAQCALSMPVNYFLTFPAFSVAFKGTWEAGQQLFIKLWYWALLFNFIKSVIISAVVFIIYKPLSKLIKLTSEKFASRKK